MNSNHFALLLAFVVIQFSLTFCAPPTLILTEQEKASLQPKLTTARLMLRGNAAAGEAIFIFEKKILKTITANENLIKKFERAMSTLRQRAPAYEPLATTFEILSQRYGISADDITRMARLINVSIDDIGHMQEQLDLATRRGLNIFARRALNSFRETITEKRVLLNQYQQTINQLNSALDRFRAGPHVPTQLPPRPLQQLVPARPRAQAEPAIQPAPAVKRMPTPAVQKTKPRTQTTSTISPTATPTVARPPAHRRQIKQRTKRAVKRKKRVVVRKKRKKSPRKRRPVMRKKPVRKRRPTYLRKRIDPSQSKFLSDEKLQEIRLAISVAKEILTDPDAQAAISILENRVLPVIARERMLILKFKMALPILAPLGNIDFNAPTLPHVLEAYKRLKQVSEEYNISVADAQRIPPLFDLILRELQHANQHVERALSRATDEFTREILEGFKKNLNDILNKLQPHQAQLTRFPRNITKANTLFELMLQARSGSPRKMKRKPPPQRKPARKK